MRTTGELLDVPKAVRTAPPKRTKAAGARHVGFDIHLDAVDDPGKFIAFVRVNATLPESFSIGLRYEEPGLPPVVLLRVNGTHGPHVNPDGTVIEDAPHLHAPTPDERTRPPPRRRWAAGPPTATALPAECGHLASAWNILITEAKITPSEEVMKALSALRGSVAQLVAEELLS